MLERTRRKCTPKTKIKFFGVNDPSAENVRNSVPREFVITPIRVLCSSFTEIDAGKWVNWCAVLLTKSSQNAVLSAPFSARLAEGTNSLQGSVPHDPTSPCKIWSQSVSICRSYSRSYSYDHVSYALDISKRQRAALHCYKTHARINRKIRNSTPVKL